MFVVLRDLSVPPGASGRFLAAGLKEWAEGAPEVRVYRGPDAPAEVLPARRLEEVPCQGILEGPDGFWECHGEGEWEGQGEPASLGEAKKRSYKKSSFKKKAPRKKKAFKKKAQDRPRPSLPELTQAMWAMVFHEAFQRPPPGTRPQYEPAAARRGGLGPRHGPRSPDLLRHGGGLDADAGGRDGPGLGGDGPELQGWVRCRHVPDRPRRRRWRKPTAQD